MSNPEYVWDFSTCTHCGYEQEGQTEIVDGSDGHYELICNSCGQSYVPEIEDEFLPVQGDEDIESMIVRCEIQEEILDLREQGYTDSEIENILHLPQGDIEFWVS